MSPVFHIRLMNFVDAAIVTILPAGNAVIALTFAENILQPLMNKPDEPFYGHAYNWAVRMLAFCCISKSCAVFGNIIFNRSAEFFLYTVSVFDNA